MKLIIKIQINVFNVIVTGNMNFMVNVINKDNTKSIFQCNYNIQ